MALTDEQSREVEQYLLGSCNDAEGLADSMRVNVDDVYAACQEAEIECCAWCGWWFTNADLELVEEEYVCEDCRSE